LLFLIVITAPLFYQNYVKKGIMEYLLLPSNCRLRYFSKFKIMNFVNVSLFFAARVRAKILNFIRAKLKVGRYV